MPYLIALILGLMAYRAMRKAMGGGGTKKGRRGEPSEPEAPTAGDAESRAPQAAGPGGPELAAAGMPAGALAPDTVHLSNTLETDAAISRELVKQDPRRAAQVVKEWLSDGQ